MTDPIKSFYSGLGVLQSRADELLHLGEIMSEAGNERIGERLIAISQHLDAVHRTLRRAHGGMIREQIGDPVAGLGQLFALAIKMREPNPHD
jgi:hypothetical protein